MNFPQWIAILLLLSFLSVGWGIDRRMRRLEVALDRLSRHVGALPPLAAAPSDRVKTLAATPGSQVEAIRALREEMGLDVKAARKIVKSLAAQARKTHA